MPTNKHGYAAILAEAERLGWPKYHRYDLTEIDRQALLEDRPTTEFWWIVTEFGTLSIFPRDEKDLDLAKACQKRAHNWKHYAYHYDGQILLPVSCAEIVEQLTVALAGKRRRGRPLTK